MCIILGSIIQTEFDSTLDFELSRFYCFIIIIIITSHRNEIDTTTIKAMINMMIIVLLLLLMMTMMVVVVALLILLKMMVIMVVITATISSKDSFNNLVHVSSVFYRYIDIDLFSEEQIGLNRLGSSPKHNICDNIRLMVKKLVSSFLSQQVLVSLITDNQMSHLPS